MRILIIICIAVGFIACSKETKDSFTLAGTIEGRSVGNAILMYTVYEDSTYREIEDTTRIVDGKFVFKGKLKHPSAATLVMDDIDLQLYIEPSDMTLSLSANDPSNYKLKGSKTQAEYDILRSETKEYEKKISETRSIVYPIVKQIETANDDVKRDSLFRIFNEYRPLLESAWKNIGQISFDFARKHPDYLVSADRLFHLAKINAIPIDSIKTVYDNLTDNVKLSVIGQLANEEISKSENKKNSLVGAIAPDFSTKGLKGETVKLSDFRNKNYVLLDFWASWCGPCIQGIPHIKELYEKYHNKGLVIIGISADSDKSKWLGAIEKHGIGIWHQVLEVQDMEKANNGVRNKDDIKEKYDIEGIPCYLLIDKEGRITGRWAGYDEANQKEMNAILEGIYKN